MMLKIKIHQLHEKANTTPDMVLCTTTKPNTIVKPLEGIFVKKKEEPTKTPQEESLEEESTNEPPKETISRAL